MMDTEPIPDRLETIKRRLARARKSIRAREQDAALAELTTIQGTLRSTLDVLARSKDRLSPDALWTAHTALVAVEDTLPGSGQTAPSLTDLGKVATALSRVRTGLSTVVSTQSAGGDPRLGPSAVALDEQGGRLDVDRYGMELTEQSRIALRAMVCAGVPVLVLLLFRAVSLILRTPAGGTTVILNRPGSELSVAIALAGAVLFGVLFFLVHRRATGHLHDLHRRCEETARLMLAQSYSGSDSDLLAQLVELLPKLP